jgi:hypothetical protein
MGNILNVIFVFIGNVISMWIIIEILEKLLEVTLPKERIRKFFWLMVAFSTLTSLIVGF